MTGMRRIVPAVVLLGMLLGLIQSSSAQLGRVDLLQGLASGVLRAEFRGNGDSSVVGRLWAVSGGPSQVTIAPGTEFWPLANGDPNFGQRGQGSSGQLGGFGQSGSGQRGQGGLGQLGGRQGMGALGQPSIGLSRAGYAQFVVPTACTNLGLPSPTRRDIMVPIACPDPRIAGIAALHGQLGVEPTAVQIAVWALANDPPRGAVDTYLEKAAKAARADHPDVTVTAASLLASAAALLQRVGLSPQGFRLFQ